MKLGLIGAVGATLVLSACGGSSSNENVDASVTLDQLVSRIEGIESVLTFDPESIDPPSFDTAIPTPFEALPIGSFNYTGIALVGEEPETDEAGFIAIGSSTMSVNFSTRTITGQANNFFELTNLDGANEADDLSSLQGERIAGSLTFNFENPDDAGPDFDEVDPRIIYAGTMIGTLTKLDNSQFNANRTMFGAFSGDDGVGFIAEGFDETIDNEAVAGSQIGLLALQRD